MDLPDEQMLKLFYEDWSGCFLRNLNAMRQAELMCDVKILLKDGIILAAHSCVLAAASPFFSALLSDKDYPEIDMSEFPAELIKQVLEFIYTGEVLVCKGNVEILYSVVQSVNVPVLIEILRSVFISLQKSVDCQSQNNSLSADVSSSVAQMSSQKRGRGRPRKGLPLSIYKDSLSISDLQNIKHEHLEKNYAEANGEVTVFNGMELKHENAGDLFHNDANLEALVLEPDVEGACCENRSWDCLQDLRPVNKRKEWKALKNPVKIEDVKVPDDGSVSDRAEKTLPNGLFLAPTTTGDKTVRGVFAGMHLKKGATFGPYQGEIVTDWEKSKESRYCWKIYKNCKLLHWIDGQDESKANWMRFVQHAETPQEQNIEAFQHDGNLYFRSIRDILPQKELLVRYGNQYSARLRSPGAEQPEEGETSIDGYTCTVCDKMYATDVMYWKHMRSVHGEPIPVEIYNKIQEERIRNLEDKRRAKGITSDCDSSTADNPPESPVKKPSEIINKPDGRRKKRRGRPRKYVNIDCVGPDGYECSVCHRSFKTPAVLKQHSTIHSSDKPYKCDMCSKGFTQRGNLRMHMMSHTGERPFVCSICGKDFNRRGELKKHIIRHQGHRPFKCTTCGKGFGDWGNLNRHKKVHTGEKPFKCHICGKTFSQTSNLRTHIKRHTGEKPHKCHMCEKCFGDLGHLRTHLRRHTGEKPFLCSFCGKGFVDKQSMRKHSDRHISKPSLLICSQDQIIFPSKSVVTPVVIPTVSQ